MNELERGFVCLDLRVPRSSSFTLKNKLLAASGIRITLDTYSGTFSQGTRGDTGLPGDKGITGCPGQSGQKVRLCWNVILNSPQHAHLLSSLPSLVFCLSFPLPLFPFLQLHVSFLIPQIIYICNPKSFANSIYQYNLFVVMEPKAIKEIYNQPKLVWLSGESIGLWMQESQV